MSAAMGRARVESVCAMAAAALRTLASDLETEAAMQRNSGIRVHRLLQAKAHSIRFWAERERPRVADAARGRG
jgi:hypothetical protein